MRKTNPIQLKPHERQILCGPEVRNNRLQDAPGKTNPISTRAALAAEDRWCETKPIPGGVRETRAGVTVQTNPIAGPPPAAKPDDPPGESKTVCLDVCTICHVVWFDPNEFEVLPKLAQKPPDFQGMPNEAKRALAMARLELLK